MAQQEVKHLPPEIEKCKPKFEHHGSMTVFTFNNVKYDRSEIEMLIRWCSKRMVIYEDSVAFVLVNGRFIYGRFKMSMLGHYVKMMKELDTLRIGFNVVNNCSEEMIRKNNPNYYHYYI